MKNVTKTYRWRSERHSGWCHTGVHTYVCFRKIFCKAFSHQAWIFILKICKEMYENWFYGFLLTNAGHRGTLVVEKKRGDTPHRIIRSRPDLHTCHAEKKKACWFFFAFHWWHTRAKNRQTEEEGEKLNTQGEIKYLATGVQRKTDEERRDESETQGCVFQNKTSTTKWK